MYDNKLLEIDFYKNSRIHKLMLPYIGSEYEKYKVLIVGESHYLRKDSDREKVKDFNKWLADKNEIKLMVFVSNNFSTVTLKVSKNSLGDNTVTQIAP